MDKEVSHIRSIPTLPPILSQLVKTLDDPSSSAADLERILRHDQSLTSKLLAVSNSAYYGCRHQITNVRRAVVAIGFNEVRNICMGLSLMGFLHPSTFEDPQGAETLWLHSLMAAEGSRQVAVTCGAIEAETAFTTGLLHDIGKVILAAFFPDEIRALNELMAERGLYYREAELQLKLNHERLGRELAQAWSLPPMFGEVLGRHHNPTPTQPYFAVVAVVHCADYLAQELGFPSTKNADPPYVEPQAMEGIQLNQGGLLLCKKNLQEREEAVRELWQGLIG